MTISTITTTISHGIALGGNYSDQLTVTSTGSITSNSGSAIQGSDTGITVTNAGMLQGGNAGIYLLNGGGYVVNAAGGRIIGSKYGVVTGQLFGNSVPPSTVSNAGTISGGNDGISLYEGGGVVTNTGTIIGGIYGVYIPDGGTLLNSGTIIGSAFHAAVDFTGTAADRMIVMPGAVTIGTISGGSGRNTLELASGALFGTIANLNGHYNGFHNVALDTGARWTIAGDSFYDSFDITGVTQANIVEKQAGGSATFGVSGSRENLIIEGSPLASFSLSSDGNGGTEIVDVGGGVSTITTTINSGINFGLTTYNPHLTIAYTGAVIGGAVGSAQHSTLTNFGSITGGSDGVALQAGGEVINAATGVILASEYGVYVDRTLGTLINAGTVSAGKDGVVFIYGGNIGNSGVIAGSTSGIFLSREGTITNSGTISGRTDAVQFYGTNSYRLIDDPGAVFIGKVAGGRDNTLELAAGGGTGTLTGLGSAFLNFSQLVLDAGANWVLSGANTIASVTGTGTLTNSGTITGTNFYLIDLGAGGAVTNTGTGLISGAIGGIELSDGGLVANTGTAAVVEGPGSGVYSTGAAGTVLNSGTLSGGLAGVYLRDGGTFTNSGAAALVTGSAHYGLLVNGAAGIVFNSGTIVGQGTGVVLRGGGQVTNQGTIAGVTEGGISLYPVGGTITNSGLVTGNLYGIAAGEFLFGGTAANPPVASQIVNTGTITGGSFGVVQQLGTVTNAASANLSGGQDGIYFSAVGTVAVSNQGIISGGERGIDAALAYGIILNSGTITGTAKGGIYLADGGRVVNSASTAVIYGGLYGIRIIDQSYSANVINSGTIQSLFDAITINGGGFVSNSASGLIAADSGTDAGVQFTGTGAAAGSSATFVNAGTLTAQGADGVDLGVAGTVVNSGLILGLDNAIYFDNTGDNLLRVGAGAEFSGNVIAAAGATDSLELLAGAGTLTGLGTQFLGFQTIAFDAGAAWTISGTSLALADGEVINGFHHGDTIDVTNLLANAETYANGRLTLANGALPIATLSLPENPGLTSADFFLHPDNTGGTDITTDALCYLRGTRILTPTGEVPIEDIAIGDLLVTRFSGFRRVRWIGRQTRAPRTQAQRREHAPVRIRAGALAEGVPARDLYVSPGHSMLVGGNLLLAKLLVNGVTITQDLAPPLPIEYFQIEFDAHDCIIAHGAWSESYADAPGLRARFDNAGDYHALYPDAQPPEALALCAPRPEKGAKLQAALAPIAARAAAAVPPGPLRGWIERIRAPRTIEGWAWDEANPDLPVLLEALLDGQMIGTLLAGAHREDLETAGFGAGRCAFYWTAPVRLPADAAARLHLRRACDGAALPGSATLPAVAPAPPLRLAG